MDSNKRHAEVLEHLTTLRAGSFWQQVFSPYLEQAYQTNQNQWYRDAIRFSSLLAILLLLASYLVEWGTGITHDTGALVARAIAIIGLSVAYIYIRRSKRLTWKYWVVTLNTLILTAALLVIAHDTAQPIKMIYYTNVFFVAVVVFTFIRLPLNFTNTLGLVLLIMVACALYLDSMNLQVSAHIMFFLCSGTFIAVMVSSRTEKMSRESFLKSELIEFEKRHLRDLNERLQEQITLDRVTHLYNRMAFDDKLLSMWSLCSQNDQRLVLVAIHIEHFGYFNEKRGAESGDDLLREMSRKIRSVLQDSNDAAARVSGGRFVLLLTGSEKEVNDQLEALRGQLLNLSTLQRCTVLEGKVYLSWGRVNLEVDIDRDPRGVIDRMFNHLGPIEDLVLSHHTQAVAASIL
ncbi:MAG: GGDEF domain-containing protein [Ketobacter sp.]|nr:MAG: GGDEF domain-containing protein [Ketobacter sp.]